MFSGKVVFHGMLVENYSSFWKIASSSIFVRQERINLRSSKSDSGKQIILITSMTVRRDERQLIQSLKLLSSSSTQVISGSLLLVIISI